VDAVPSALAAVIAILVLGALIRMLRDTEPTRVAPSGRVSRRRFVGTTAATAAGGALALVIGQAVANGFRTASAARAAIRLPQPAQTAAP
ncbi:twin-arginine translocation signal domain-containing protein, partial [Bacillus sp. SIMBA_069]